MIIRLIFLFLILFTSNSYSKDINKIRNNIPSYPNSIIYKLDKKLNAPIDVILVKDDFYKAMEFYNKNMKKKGWNLIFPNELEYKIWIEALNSDKSKEPVITLIFRKDKYNCNIGISSFKEKNSYYNSIISIYINVVE